MNSPSLVPFALAVAVCCASWCHAAPLVVAQGRAAQRAGTKLVDVNYSISGGVPPYTVALQGSLDGGATWTLPVTTVSGNVGAGVTAGTNRLITWNAGADWAGHFGNNVKFRVNGTDSATPPVPAGFALIPAGNFTMGQDGIAEPVHTVYVSAFFMAKHETTKELWDSVRAWGLTNGYTDLAVGNGSSASKGANHPVHSITWYDMVKWCNARSQKEGLTPCYTVSGATYKTDQSTPVCNWAANGYRLPTEAEWEKAARGGVSGKLFPWGGDTITHSQANYYSDSFFAYDVSPTRGYHSTYYVGNYPFSSPVGSFAPNGYGLYDMAGNMSEWCWDWWYGPYAEDSQTDPRGAASGTVRVFRGGSCFNYADDARCANRYFGYPSDSARVFGFRVARSSVP
jgi:formylglycine-generating enzyme required for sulfatase activity